MEAAKNLSPSRRTTLARIIRFSVLFTISYNVIEAIIAITAGLNALSSALLGFGLDSVIEVTSALAIAWQFSGGKHEEREKIALRIIAVSFFLLAGFVTIESLTSLFSGKQAEHSTIGIILGAVSLAIMPVVFYIQRRVGKELGSQSTVADSKQTLLCTYLSAVLLVGLLFNSLFGLWWADSLAALVIAAFVVKEGIEAWKGDSCCAPNAILFEKDNTSCACGPNCTGGC